MCVCRWELFATKIISTVGNVTLISFICVESSEVFFFFFISLKLIIKNLFTFLFLYTITHKYIKIFHTYFFFLYMGYLITPGKFLFYILRIIIIINSEHLNINNHNNSKKQRMYICIQVISLLYNYCNNKLTIYFFFLFFYVFLKVCAMHHTCASI